MSLTEFGMVASSFTLLGGYHLLLWRRVRRTPEQTTIGANQSARRAWVDMIIDEKQDLLAVHNLRNWTTASSLLATSAVIIGLSLMGGAFTPDGNSAIHNAMNLFGERSEQLATVKIFGLAVTFLAAFFSFTIAIRHFNYVGFLISLPRKAPDRFPVVLVAENLSRAANGYTVGMRLYFLSIPIAMWIFGPTWMFLSTIMLLLALRHMDFRPKLNPNRAPQ
ncbi:MAG: DUF599 domain-containing protein [Magnetococcales bacterium]|nr:DUF599 domain-containing protein [Magnetococcales bacterium]